MERLRVLVVDERQEHTSAVVSRLRDGFRVESAASYDEALEKLNDAGAGYQIALLNQLTGDPGGLKRRRSIADRRRNELLSLARAIRERSPGTDVIFLPFPGAEGMQAAAHAITLEPSRLTPDQLVELVHAVTDQRQQLTVATRGTRQLAELLQAVAQFGGSFELRKILTAACEALVDLLEVQHAAIWLFPQDLSTGDIQIQAEHPRLGDESLAFRFASAPAVRRLVDTRAAVTVEDLTIGKELGTFSERVKARDVTSVLLSPLFSRDRVHGCIALSTTGSRRAFRSDQIDVTHSFAALIAVALENGRLLQMFADQASIALASTDRPVTATAVYLSQPEAEILGNLGSTTLDERLHLIATHAIGILNAESCGVLLVKEPGVLSLEASVGHRPGGFEKSRTFPIRSGRGSGLTGHIASEGKLFNAFGEALTTHPAVRSSQAGHLKSGRCHSLLALPLFKRSGRERALLGLLRIENKKGPEGHPAADIGFTSEDERRLQLFGEAVTIAIESADLVQELREKKELLERLVGSSPMGIVAANEHGVITTFNEKAQEILGYSAAEATQIDVRQVYDDPQEPIRVKHALRLSPTGADVRDTLVRSKTGEVIPIRLSAAALGATEQARGTVGYFEDLRPIKDTTRRLQLLAEVSDVMARPDQTIEGLSKLARIVSSLVPGSVCRVLLLDESPGTVVARAAHADDEGVAASWRSALGEIVPLADRDDVERVIAAGVATVFDATDDYGSYVTGGLSDRLEIGRRLSAVLMVPLISGANTVGILELGLAGRARITGDEKDLVSKIAWQAAILIDHSRLREAAEHRRTLLTALERTIQAMRPERQMDEDELQRDVVRTAADLLGYTAGCFYKNHPRRSEVEVAAVHLLPQHIVGRCEAYTDPLTDEGVAARVVASGKAHVFAQAMNLPDYDLHGCPFRTVIAVPLLRAGGEVEAVLVVAGEAAHQRFIEVDRDVLERFAAHATSVFHASRLWNWDVAAFEQRAALRKISDYMLGASDQTKVLASLLTGATAWYGLQFNRAAVLLFDSQFRRLEGQLGIGYMSEPETRKSWGVGRGTVDEYLEALERHGHESTPLDEQIKTMSIGTPEDGLPDVFRRAAHEGAAIFESADHLAELPRALLESWQPRPPAAIIPLSALGQLLGFVVVDNMVSRAPIANEDLAPLIDLANTAGVALTRLGAFPGRTAEADKPGATQGERPSSEGREASFYVGTELQKMYSSIARSARRVFQADSAVLWSHDPQRDTFSLADWAGVSKSRWNEFAKRPPGKHQTAYTVLERGWIHVDNIRDTEKHPFLTDDTRHLLIDVGVHSFQGIALSAGAEDLGVLYLNYDRPRTFGDADREAATAFAIRAARELKDAQKLDELHRARDTAKFVASLTTIANLDKTLRSVVEGTCTASRADVVALFVYDDERERMSQPVLSGPVRFPKRTRRYETPRDSLVWRMLNAHKEKVVEDTASDAEFEPRRFRKDEGIASCVVLPLRARQAKVGVMFVNYRQQRRFTPDDLTNMKLFADQAAVAILNAQLYDRVTRQEKSFKKAYAASQAAGGSLNLDEILKRVAEQAWHLAASRTKGFSFADVRLVDGNEATIVAAYPVDRMKDHNVNMEPIDLIRGRGGRRGVIGRTFRDAKSQLVPDVRQDADYLEGSTRIFSEITAPITGEGKVIGIINVEHGEVGAFAELDREALEALASQASIAIRSVRHYEELRLTQSRLRASMTIAANAAIGWNWSHTVGKYAPTLRDHIQRTREDLAEGASASRLGKRLDAIDAIISELKHPPVTVMLDENVTRISINRFLGRKVDPLKARWFAEGYKIDFKPLRADCFVHVNENWLGQAADYIIANAKRAMETSREKRLNVVPRRTADSVEIDFVDTGCGMPAGLMDQLTKAPILESQGAKGTGVGLLIASSVLQAYDGRLEPVQSSTEDPTGTTIRIKLPAWNQRANEGAAGRREMDA